MISDKIVLLDLDGTLIRGQSQVYFLKFMFLKMRIDIKTYLSVLWWAVKYKLGSRVIDTNLAKSVYKKFLAGMSPEELGLLITQMCERILYRQINTKVLDRVRSLQAKGYKVILVSASLEPIVSRVSKHLGFDEYLATQLELKNGIYTGRIVGPINEGENKRKRLEARLGAGKNEGYAFTDSESDISIFGFVNNFIVVNPDKELEVLAKSNGWGIME